MSFKKKGWLANVQTTEKLGVGKGKRECEGEFGGGGISLSVD